jgi:hypothetical protein
MGGQAVRGRMVMGCEWGCDLGIGVGGECGVYGGYGARLFVVLWQSERRGVAGNKSMHCGATTHLTVRSTDSSTYSHMEHLSPGEPWQSTRTAMAPRKAAQTHTPVISKRRRRIES